MGFFNELKDAAFDGIMNTETVRLPWEELVKIVQQEFIIGEDETFLDEVQKTAKGAIVGYKETVSKNGRYKFRVGARPQGALLISSKPVWIFDIEEKRFYQLDKDIKWKSFYDGIVQEINIEKRFPQKSRIEVAPSNEESSATNSDTPTIQNSNNTNEPIDTSCNKKKSNFKPLIAVILALVLICFACSALNNGDPKEEAYTYAKQTISEEVLINPSSAVYPSFEEDFVKDLSMVEQHNNLSYQMYLVESYVDVSETNNTSDRCYYSVKIGLPVDENSELYTYEIIDFFE